MGIHDEVPDTGGEMIVTPKEFAIIDAVKNGNCTKAKEIAKHINMNYANAIFIIRDLVELDILIHDEKNATYKVCEGTTFRAVKFRNGYACVEDEKKVRERVPLKATYEERKRRMDLDSTVKVSHWTKEQIEAHERLLTKGRPKYDEKRKVSFFESVYSFYRSR